MNYALIKNGICENIIEADTAFVLKIQSQYDAIIPADGTQAEVGATWDGTVFIRKETPISVTPSGKTLEEKVDELIVKVDALLISTGTVIK